VVYLAVALVVRSKGSMAALDASPAETASSNNLVQDKHDFQEDVKLPTITEAESKMIDLDLADEEESSGDYLDDDQDIDKVEEEDDYEDDYDEDDYEDDDDWESSGDYDDDDEDDEEYLYDDDDYDSEEEDPDWSFEDDKSDNHNDEDLMYEYNNEDYEGDDYDFSQVEKTKTYQPPQITRSGRPTPHQSGDDVKVEVPSGDHGTSQNLLISVFVASGLASFALFTLAFVMCFCNKSRQSQTAKSAAAAVHNKQPWTIITSGSSSKVVPPASSIIRTDRRYQPVPTHENRANHSIENSNAAVSAGQQQKQLEEKLLMSA